MCRERGSHEMIPSAAWRYWRLNDPFCGEHVTVGRKTPKLPLSPWDFVTLSEEDRATAIGNMHKKLVTIARVIQGSVDNAGGQTDAQTDRRTQMCSTQCFATAPAGEVIRNLHKLILSAEKWIQLLQSRLFVTEYSILIFRTNLGRTGLPRVLVVRRQFWNSRKSSPSAEVGRWKTTEVRWLPSARRSYCRRPTVRMFPGRCPSSIQTPWLSRRLERQSKWTRLHRTPDAS